MIWAASKAFTAETAECAEVDPEKTSIRFYAKDAKVTTKRGNRDLAILLIK